MTRNAQGCGRTAVRWLLSLGLPGLVAVSPGLRAETAPGSSLALTNLALKRISPGRFEVGKVQFDQEERTVRFPAVVNFRDGPIEYLVVTSGGKIHESVFRTEAAPQHIHVAMLLLGAAGAGTNALPADPGQRLPGQELNIEVAWETDGKRHRRAGEEFVRDRSVGRVMKKGSWVYNGSRLRPDGFGAQQDGSIVSLITDPDALVNNPRPGREDDDNWLANSRVAPPLETPVEVTFRLKH